MLLDEFPLIDEEFHTDFARPDQTDMLLENGWRHFGTHFYRYNIGFYRSDFRRVIPLRIRLSEFSLSKSQRRVLRRNNGLTVEIKPIEIDCGVDELFDRHKRRFDHGVPDSIYDFLSRDPARSPCEAKEIRVTDGDNLLGVSYFDIGKNATSGIYAMFEPEEKNRSLGIFTMLKEIEFSIDNRKQFYYQGYCYDGESFYDYKKRFSGIEAYDWIGNWRPLEWKSNVPLARFR